MTIHRLPPAYLQPTPPRTSARKGAETAGRTPEPGVGGESPRSGAAPSPPVATSASTRLRAEAAALSQALQGAGTATERARLKRRFLRTVLSERLPRSSTRHPDMAGLLETLEQAIAADPELSTQFARALQVAVAGR